MAKKTKEDLQNVISQLSLEMSLLREKNEDLVRKLNAIEDNRTMVNHYRMDEMQEKLYAAGIEPRPTIMQKIIDREVELVKTIQFMISECEKETGRGFDRVQLLNDPTCWSTAVNQLFPSRKLSPLDYGTKLHEYIARDFFVTKKLSPEEIKD